MILKRYALTVIALLITTDVMAQNLPVPDSDVSDSERTEVVCYAAQDRWVCTPKGSEKPTATIEQIKAESDGDEAESLTEDSPLNPLDPPPGVESITDTAPEQPVVNLMTETPDDVITEQSPQATNTPEPQQTVTKTQQTEEQQAKPDYAGDNWFQRYPNHWTIQIVGVANQQNLDAFVQQQKLNDRDYRIIETRVNGAPWWVVIYGHYPSRDDADRARNNLPENLASDAWLRPLSSLAGE
ncbi:SPOR domain-containing protein [Marinicella gelatinilytica]|uniref:SPOR domain-containing protein n=1 Tax=Marinicella gelatinilytica TaxID=2996017 RepID=UPI002260DAD2|nr:SPOR domain-containing protein [Marinicella gelatinilytica]MCX7544168.1 SPOR domain-containing protein [Marinicella gelatinilytica]